jgi:hypothetical protein
MLSQPQSTDPYLLDKLHRLNNDPDFKSLVEYLRANLPHLSHQSVYSVGEVRCEFSGAYKVFEELLNLIDLEEYKDRPQVKPQRWA